MALLVDASTPAAAAAASGSVSVTPPSGASGLLIGVSNAQNNATLPSSVTVGGSAATFLQSEAANNSAVALYWFNVASGGSALTVATNDGLRYDMSVIVLTGAATSQTATAVIGTGAASTPALPTITTGQAGSQCFGMFCYHNSATAPTAASGQTATFPSTTSQVVLDATPGEAGWMQTTTAVNGAAGSTVTLSDSAPTGSWAAVGIEILASAATASPSTFSVSDPQGTRIPGIH